MASHSAAKAVHKTLSGTTVDTVTLTGGWSDIEIINRGTTDLTVVFDNGATPSDPTALADDTEIIQAGSALMVDADPGDGNFVAKLKGSGNAYSVIGVGE